DDGRSPVEGEVRLLQDRQAERVRVEADVHLARRPYDEVADVDGGSEERSEVDPAPFEHEGGADEEQRGDVDEVAFLDPRCEVVGEVRGLHACVEPESDQTGGRDAANHSKL